MRQTPLFSGITYLFLGTLFTIFAIQDVQSGGWGFFTYLLVLFATLDIASGIKMINFHVKLNRHLKNKQ